MRKRLYRRTLKIWNLDLAKAPGFDLPKKGPYYNIGPFLEVESREFWLGPNSKFSVFFGIFLERRLLFNPEDVFSQKKITADYTLNLAAMPYVLKYCGGINS